MSNMTKAFEKKSALRRIHMADGGLVDKAKTDLGNRGAVIDAAVDGKPAPTPAPKPAPAPAPKAAPVSEDAARAAVGMAPKKGMLRSLLGLAEGGHVQGPGGPREDKVPAMLSNGEYVLPAKTVQKLGGPEELDELVEQTNDGREPARHRSGLRHLAGGGVIEIGADGLPRTNGVSIPAGNQLATIPGEVAQKLPGTQMATVPGQTARTIPPVQPMDTSDLKARAASIRQQFPSGAGMQSSVGATAVAEAAAPKPGMLRRLGGAIGTLSNVAALGAAGSAMADASPYQANLGSIDAAAPGATLRGAGRMVATDAANLVGLGAKAVDSVGGFFGAKPGAAAAVDGFVKNNFGDSVAPKAAPYVGTSLAGAGRGFARPPGTPDGPGPEGLLNTNGGIPTDAAPSPRSLAQARYLSENGVSAATQASAPVAGDLRSLKTQPGQFLNLGSFQGPDNIYGTSSKPGGRVNSFVGAGDPNREESQQTKDAVAKLQSDLAADKLATAQKTEAENLARASQGNAGAINARFDAMAGKVAGSYSKAGKGNENKRLLEIEAQRNNALEADARNTTSVRGQTLQAQNNSAENVLKGKQIDEQARAHAATLRGQLAPKPINPLDAAKFVADRTDQARKNEETGAEAVNKAVAAGIQRRFPGADKDQAMGAQAQDYANFFRQLPDKLLGRTRSEDPTEREAAYAEADQLFDTRNKVNATAGASFRGTTSTGPVLPKGGAKPVEFGDYWGEGSLPWKEGLRLPARMFNMDYSEVQPMDNGQVVGLSDLTKDASGSKNASQVSALHRQREYQRQAEEKARIEKLKQEAKK